MSFINTSDLFLEENHAARVRRRILFAKERGTLVRGERFVSREKITATWLSFLQARKGMPSGPGDEFGERSMADWMSSFVTSQQS